MELLLATILFLSLTYEESEAHAQIELYAHEYYGSDGSGTGALAGPHPELEEGNMVMQTGPRHSATGSLPAIRDIHLNSSRLSWRGRSLHRPQWTSPINKLCKSMHMKLTVS